MTIKSLTLALLVFSSQNLMAANHMVIFGGSGDPKGPTTIFDENIEILGKNLSNSNWKYQAAFNGGHSETESILAKKYKNPVAPTREFTKQNYESIIADYKKKILSGEIKSGDQLMIVIDTHGAQKFGNEKTHLISANGAAEKPSSNSEINYNTLSGSDLVSLDSLEEIVKITNEKGIKLGIIDMSCHSGNTLALKQNAPNTCVITASGPVHFSYAGGTSFSGQFWNELKPGKNLEEAFLSARLKAQDVSFPMISTTPGNEVTDEVYDSITPYLYYKTNSSPAEKISSYLDKNSSDIMICKREAQFQNLISKIETLQKASSGMSKVDAEDLKKALTKYKAQQDSMLKTLADMGVPLLSTKEVFSSPITPAKKGKKAEDHTLYFTWKDIVFSNPDRTIAAFEEYSKKARNAEDKATYQAVLSNWRKIKIRKEEILKQYPKMNQLNGASKKLFDEMEDNWNEAHKLGQLEKKFYDGLYRQKQTRDKSDPCAQIVF